MIGRHTGVTGLRDRGRVPRAAVAGLVLLVLSARPLSAQLTPGTCTASPATVGGAPVGADACAKARDLFAFVSPQVGIALSGGNPLLGEGGTLGGWPKRAISVRLTAVNGQLPRGTVPVALTGATSSNFDPSRTPVPVPSVDLGVGLIKGIPLGITNVGGVDVLLSGTYLPTVEKNGLSLEPGASSLALGYGVRVGALQESALVPGVSVSYMRRKLPAASLGYATGNDTLRINNFAVTSNALRVVASKRFLMFGVAAGLGRDEIDASAGMQATVNETVGGNAQRAAVVLDGMRNQVARSTAFVNASFSLLVLRVVAEYGVSSAGAAPAITNRFGDRTPNEGYRYGSVGITMRF